MSQAFNQKLFLPLVCMLCFLSGCIGDTGTRPLKKALINGDIKPLEIGVSMQKEVSLGYNDIHTQGLELTNFDTDEKITIYTCQDYLSQVAVGFSSRTTFDRTMESFFIKTCHPLLFLKNANSSHSTNFKEPYFRMDNLNKFPAKMGNIYQINRHPPCKDFLTLQECMEGTVEEYSNDKIAIKGYSINITTDVESAGFDILAKGDINHDGWEDLMIFYYHALHQGTYRKYGTFCIEWPENNKLPNVFRCLNNHVSNIFYE